MSATHVTTIACVQAEVSSADVGIFKIHSAITPQFRSQFDFGFRTPKYHAKNPVITQQIGLCNKPGG